MFETYANLPIAIRYAGTLNSALTNHGIKQAHRLGESLAQDNVIFSHIFSSPLSRACETAEAVRNAQPAFPNSENSESLEIITAQELVERNYGVYEGRPYASRSEWMKTGSDGHEGAKGGVESAISLVRRGDAFLDQYLLPLFDEDSNEEFVVAIVAHGMLLSHLWRRLLLRLPKESLSIAPEITAARGNIVPERLGGWSNTGYLELSILKDEQPDSQPDSASEGSHQLLEAGEVATLPTPVPPPLQSEGAEISVVPPQREGPTIVSMTTPGTLTGWSTTIVAIDSRKHLLGLKRQPGGIGSLAHDQGQKKLDTFFKPLKLA